MNSFLFRRNRFVRDIVKKMCGGFLGRPTERQSLYVSNAKLYIDGVTTNDRFYQSLRLR